MKHTVNTTALLLVLFLVAQLVGIGVLSFYIDFQTSAQTGQTTVQDTYFVEPPKVENESYSFGYILVAIILGTVLLLWLIKLGKILIWKVWFFFSVFFTLSFAWYPIFYQLPWALVITGIAALTFGIWKVFFPNMYIHNITEIFIYAGLAAIFVPILNLVSAFILLVLISIYDIYMVHKAKKMVTLAKASMKHNIVAGLFIGNGKTIDEKKTAQTVSSKTKKASQAIIGGGDIAFPLLFSGAAMKYTGMLSTGFFVSIGALIGITVLMLMAKPSKFYPAMPPISIGAIIGFLIAILI